jgi:hypothetical protein
MLKMNLPPCPSKIPKIALPSPMLQTCISASSMDFLQPGLKNDVTLHLGGAEFEAIEGLFFGVFSSLWFS